jgi:hypothetical protein
MLAKMSLPYLPSLYKTRHRMTRKNYRVREKGRKVNVGLQIGFEVLLQISSEVL